jgi:hypothetical protein
LENIVSVRTFFYYGPNQTTGDRAATNMQDGQINRPSNTTIENFVNSTSELNLAQDSKQYDIVYVVYQKTGYLRNQRSITSSGVTTASFPSKEFSQLVPWSTSTPDTYNYYAPTFIIYRLQHDGTRYIMLGGYPKFTQTFEPV